MMLPVIEARARYALAEAGAGDVEVFLAEHEGTVQVLVDVQLSPEIVNQVQATLKAAHPGVVFDFVLP